jgi:hypothetical protein
MLFLNGQLALSLQDCLCVNTCITMTLSTKCTNIFESLNLSVSSSIMTNELEINR